MNQSPAMAGDEAALRLVVEGTATETGAGFFRALVRNLALVMSDLLLVRFRLMPKKAWSGS